jgi:hypothetical protein
MRTRWICWDRGDGSSSQVTHWKYTSNKGWLERSPPNSNFYLIGCSWVPIRQFMHKQVKSRNFYYIQKNCYTCMGTNKFSRVVCTLVRHIQNLLIMDWSVQFCHTWRKENQCVNWLTNSNLSPNSLTCEDYNYNNLCMINVWHKFAIIKESSKNELSEKIILLWKSYHVTWFKFYFIFPFLLTLNY